MKSVTNFLRWIGCSSKTSPLKKSKARLKSSKRRSKKTPPGSRRWRDWYRWRIMTSKVGFRRWAIDLPTPTPEAALKTRVHLLIFSKPTLNLQKMFLLSLILKCSIMKMLSSLATEETILWSFQLTNRTGSRGILSPLRSRETLQRNPASPQLRVNMVRSECMRKRKSTWSRKKIKTILS